MSDFELVMRDWLLGGEKAVAANRAVSRGRNFILGSKARRVRGLRDRAGAVLLGRFGV